MAVLKSSQSSWIRFQSLDIIFRGFLIHPWGSWSQFLLYERTCVQQTSFINRLLSVESSALYSAPFGPS